MIQIAGATGRLPADIWAMTPRETAEMVEAWNGARADTAPAPMTRDRLEDLVDRYV